MQERFVKPALWGFVFGTAGLFVLGMLSLASNAVAAVSSPLFWPGRTAAAAFVGPVGSNGAVALLTLGNGILYALVFVVMSAVIRAFRPKK